MLNYINNNIPSVKVTKSDGTFLAWLDVRETGKTSKELHQLLISKGKVALNLGDNFGEGGEGFLRL